MIISINYLAVLLAAVVSFGFGALWHSPLGFSKYWMKLMNLSEDDMRRMPLTPVQAMLIGFIVTMLFAYVLAHFVALTIPAAAPAWLSLSLQLGFWVWLGFVVPILANGWLWEGKSLTLFLFNAAYQLLAVEIMAFILGMWR